MNDIRQTVDEILDRGDLPVAPMRGAALRLAELVRSGEFRASDLVEIIETDAVLAARVLRYANSAARGGRDVTSLDHAVALIGGRDLTSLALAVGFGETVAQGGPLKELRYDEWRRSTMAAEMGRRLAPARSVDPPAAFLSGLLWRFGRVVALACVEQALESSEAASAASAEYWRELVDEYESRALARIVDEWDLPDTVSAVLAARHGEVDPGVSDMVALCRDTEQLVGVVDATAVIDAEGLEATGSVSDAEARSLEPQVPDTVAAAWALAPEEASAPEGPSYVAPEPSVLEPPVHPVELRAVQRRGGAEVDYTCVGVTWNGLVLEGERDLQVNFMAKFVLHSEPTMDAFVNVVHSEAVDGGVRAEARMMALTGSQKDRWQAIVEGARAAEEPEAGPGELPIEIDATPSLPPPPIPAAASGGGGGTAVEAPGGRKPIVIVAGAAAALLAAAAVLLVLM